MTTMTAAAAGWMDSKRLSMGTSACPTSWMFKYSSTTTISTRIM